MLQLGVMGKPPLADGLYKGTVQQTLRVLQLDPDRFRRIVSTEPLHSKRVSSGGLDVSHPCRLEQGVSGISTDDRIRVAQGIGKDTPDMRVPYVELATRFSDPLSYCLPIEAGRSELDNEGKAELVRRMAGEANLPVFRIGNGIQGDLAILRKETRDSAGILTTREKHPDILAAIKPEMKCLAQLFP